MTAILIFFGIVVMDVVFMLFGVLIGGLIFTKHYDRRIKKIGRAMTPEERNIIDFVFERGKYER